MRGIVIVVETLDKAWGPLWRRDAIGQRRRRQPAQQRELCEWAAHLIPASCLATGFERIGCKFGALAGTTCAILIRPPEYRVRIQSVGRRDQEGKDDGTAHAGGPEISAASQRRARA